MEGIEGKRAVTLKWWDMIVKLGIKKLAIERSKEIAKDRCGALNMLFLRHAYLANKVQQGNINRLDELRLTLMRIDKWYRKEAER